MKINATTVLVAGGLLMAWLYLRRQNAAAQRDPYSWGQTIDLTSW